MGRPAGVTKRVAVVPSFARIALMQLSKADLLELVWDYAVQQTGDDNLNGEALPEIQSRRNLLDRYTKEGR